MTCDEVRDKELVAQYIHRRLSDAERDQFEEHFIGCEVCFAEVQDYRVLRQELSASVPVAVEQSQQAWWRSFVPVFALAGAAAAIVIAVMLPRTNEPAPASQVAVAEPATPIVTPPPAPKLPSRVELVGQLARFEPPVFQPMSLRGVEDDADRQFRAAMERYAAKDYAAAGRMLRSVVTLRPQSGDALFYLAISDLQSGRPQDAIASLEKLVALNDVIYEEDARFFLAKALLAAGDTARAGQRLSEVVALKGDRAADAQSMIARIAALPER